VIMSLSTEFDFLTVGIPDGFLFQLNLLNPLQKNVIWCII